MKYEGGKKQTNKKPADLNHDVRISELLHLMCLCESAVVESQSEKSAGDKTWLRKRTGLNSNGRCDRKETRGFRNKSAQEVKARNVQTNTDINRILFTHSEARPAFSVSHDDSTTVCSKQPLMLLPLGRNVITPLSLAV